MPPGEELGSQRSKRKRTIEDAPATDPPPQPPAKRRKRSRRSQHRTPPEFWDNLSKVPLCLRALREFNRRTVGLTAPKPPAPSVLKGDLVKQLKRFARHGGPSLRDIRGYPDPETEAASVCTMSSRGSRSRRSRGGTGTDPSSALSPNTEPTTISARDPAFGQALIDAGYHQYNRGPKPNKLEEEIKEWLARPRPSLSPSQFSDGAFEDFQLKNDEAGSESAVMTNVFPIIRGDTDIPYGQDQYFNHLAPLASGISTAKPDYWNGSPPAQVDPRVRNDLGQYIIPCNNTSRPILPNFFTEAKGPDGKASEMKRQITQDLGNGARGMLKMQSYGQDGDAYDGNAYTLGATYHSGTGTLQMYTMHPTEPTQPDGAPQYHTTQINSFGMTGNAETFREGATWYRNSMDLTQEYRDAAIAQANETANAISSGAFETSAGAAYESQSQETITIQDDSDTSLDELALDTDLSRKRGSESRQGPRKRPTTSSSARGSTSTESWKFAEDKFHSFQGHTIVDLQGDHPRDVWAYNEDGWPNGGGKQWRFWKSDGTAEYR